MKKIFTTLLIILGLSYNFKAQVLVVNTTHIDQSNSPLNLTIDAVGNLYFTLSNTHCIYKRSTTGAISVFAGGSASGYSDGSGSSAQFNYPAGMDVDASGNLIVADRDNNCIRKITPSGVVSTIAGGVISGTTDAVGSLAKFSSPNDVTIDASGNVYVADTQNNRIRKISPTGSVTTIAGDYNGYSNGIGTLALFNQPQSLTVDQSGNLYVVEANHAIRKISPANLVTTYAGTITAGYVNGSATVARFQYPSGVDVDAIGNLYVADQANHTIRMINTSGVVTSIAGNGTQGVTDGLAINSKFYNPKDLAVNSAGDIFVADVTNQRIRKIENAYCYVKTNTTNPIGSLNATVKGIINAAGNTTNSSFEYGLTTAYGSSIAATPGFVVGNTNTAISATLTSLTPNTTYHYRAVGTNSAGIQYGMDSTFHTLAVAAPSATTTNATNVLGNTAIVYGTINANGDNTTIIFEYDISPAYTFSVAATPNTASGNSVATYSANLSGLTINTQYLYRIKATNAIGTSVGGDMTFTTNSVVTSLNESQNKNQLAIFPNPANNVITINGLAKQKQIISITNILGKCVKLIETNNANDLSIDLKELTTGMYFINYNNQSYKFIKE